MMFRHSAESSIGQEERLPLVANFHAQGVGALSSHHKNYTRLVYEQYTIIVNRIAHSGRRRGC